MVYILCYTIFILRKQVRLSLFVTDSPAGTWANSITAVSKIHDNEEGNMMTTQNKTVRKPSALLFYPAGFLGKLYYRFAFKHKVNKSAIKGLKPPYLAVQITVWLDY